MMENRWEYAVLEWLRFNVEQPLKQEEAEAKEQLIAVFGVRFADGGAKAVYRQLHQVTTKNVADKTKNMVLVEAMGLLGQAGWEMVGIAQEPDRVDMCTMTCVYFKRLSVEGRAVDEPRIEPSFAG